MADLLLQLNDDGADFVIEDGDLALDQTLRSNVVVSLFSDRRLPDDQELDLGETDRRGWWADQFETGRFGSLLWALYRSKVTNETLNRTREAVLEALDWLVLADVVEDLEVDASRLDLDRIQVRVELRRGTAQSHSDVWEATLAELATFDSPDLQVQILPV